MDARELALEALRIPGFELEYFEFVNFETLEPVHSIQDAPNIAACTAIWVGGVRLIDNMVVYQSAPHGTV